MKVEGSKLLLVSDLPKGDKDDSVTEVESELGDILDVFFLEDFFDMT